MAFKFKTETWVRVYTGIKAENIQEFIKGLKIVPPGSLLYHFYINLFNYHNLPTEYPNSFAHWLATNGYEPLAAKLSIIDPTRYYDLEKLREDLLKNLSEYEGETKTCSRPFYFLHIHRYVLDTGRIAEDFDQFVEGIEKSSISSLFYHLITCRIDKRTLINDYSEWLVQQGYAKKAEVIDSIDLYVLNLYEVKKVILEILRR